MTNRKAIYLDINTTLATALDKLKQIQTEEVLLVIPRGSVIFHSIINLKIIKSEAEAMNKALSLVTVDSKGRSMAEKIGIAIFQDDTSKDREEKIEIKDHDRLEEAIPVEPMEAKKVMFRRSEHKHSRKIPKSQPIIRSHQVSEIKEIEADVSESGWARNKLVIIFISLAVIILGGVIYFVLPKATVNIDVYAEPFVHKFKLVLADQDDLNAAGQNVFKGHFMDTIKELIQTFPATGTKNNGNEASGTITIYNYTRIIQGLIPETRFVSEAGLVFRIKEEVLISPANVGGSGNLIPGRTKAKVIADEGGSNGNLPADNKFTIPGLGSTMIDLMFGKNDDPFVGGTDDEVKVVSEEDIESAHASVSKNVFLDAETELQSQATKNNELIVALIQNDIIDSVPSVAAGAKRDAFDLKVQVRSWTILPEKGELESIIKHTLNNIIPQDQELTDQTLKNARIIMDNADFLMHTIEFTVEIDGLIATKLDLDELSGSISNRSPSNVKQLLDSISDIASHKITLWPFWVNKLPILESNIKIILNYINR